MISLRSKVRAAPALTGGKATAWQASGRVEFDG